MGMILPVSILRRYPQQASLARLPCVTFLHRLAVPPGPKSAAINRRTLAGSGQNRAMGGDRVPESQEPEVRFAIS